MISTMKELKLALQNKDQDLAYKIAKEIHHNAIVTRSCANCSLPTDHATFRDKVSYEESYISGLCMPCQDLFFVEEDPIQLNLPFKESE